VLQKARPFGGLFVAAPLAVDLTLRNLSSSEFRIYGNADLHLNS
jgi:hypothetical protein